MKYTPGPWIYSARIDEGFRVHTVSGGMADAMYAASYLVTIRNQFSGTNDKRTKFEVEAEAIEYAENLLLTKYESVSVIYCKGWDEKRLYHRKGSEANLSRDLFQEVGR